MKTLKINKLLLGATLLCAGMISSASAADIIGFKIESPKSSNQNYLFAGDYAGAPGVRTNNWNNLQSTVDANTTLPITMPDGSVSNSAGNVVSGMAVVFQPNFGGGGIFNRTSGGTNDGKMFADVADTFNCSGFSQYGYIDITNIPYASYNIYCYFRPDNGNGSANTRGGFWVITNTPTGTNRIYIQNQSNDVAQTQIPVPSNTGGNYIQSTTTLIGSGGVAWSTIQGGNYGVFTGLTNSSARVWFGGLGNGSGGKDDLGNFVNGGSVAVRLKVCGFQIVQVPTGVATALYLASSNQVLHAGNPIGAQLAVLADLDTGASGVNETAGSTFSSDAPSVLTVSSTGLMTPGTNGTAHVIVSFQAKSYTNLVTVIGPTSLSISVVKTNLLAGNGQGDTTIATLLANFSDAANVPVNSYQFVSFSHTGGITVTASGIITAVTAGTFGITGAYDGLSVTTNNAGLVTTYIAPGGVAAFSVNLTDVNDPMSFHDLSGAPGARVAYWNNMVLSFGAVTNEIDNPVDYRGNALSGTVVQVLPNSAFNELLVTTGVRTTNESVMFNAFFDQGANDGTSPQSFIVVSNVPYASYDAYFYFYNDNGQPTRPGQVTIAGVTQYRINSTTAPNTPDNNGNGYVLAVQPGTTPTSISDVPYGNYIKFSGLTDNILNVNWGAVGQDIFLDAAGVTRVRLAGFQIVKNLIGLTVTNVYLQSPVPNLLPGNPATYAVTVLADFSDGTKGGNITGLAGVAFTSANTNLFTVNASGVVAPGTNTGTANLVIAYQSVSATQAVTVLSPISLKPIAVADTIYSDSVLGLVGSQAHLLATFAGNNNVDVSSFASVSFTGNNPGVAAVSTSGAITPTGTTGIVGLGATYAGSSGFNATALTVTTNGAVALKHRYSFRDAANSTIVLDSVGGANGTVYPGLSGFQSITLDGERANFPGDSTFQTAPYIALPPNLVSSMGDVTFDFWFTVRTNSPWARIFDLGASGKGTDPHNSGVGSATSGMEFSPEPGGSPNPTWEIRTPAGALYLPTTIALPVGVEHHVTLVYSPNQNIAKVYLDGTLNVSSGTIPGGTLNTLAEDNTWLGISQWDDPTLNASIDEFRLYEGALSDAEVAASDAAGPNVGLVSTVPASILTTVSGGNLNLSWPADHLGWTLQVQTNSSSIGLSTNWVNVPGSASVTNEVIPLSPANGSVFFRMIYSH